MKTLETEHGITLHYDARAERGGSNWQYATVMIRVGVEGGRKPVLARAKELGAPLLVSANSLWDQPRQRFSGWQCYTPFDVALDSGGFVAMKKYGRYRWTPGAYARLAKAMQPTWWAQMDFCCEPEIASDSAQVGERISQTVSHLQELNRIAAGENIQPPLPVLQGWHPADYTRGPIYDEAFQWPALVGVGSVCRRPVEGATGIMSVIEAINSRVPASVKLHLFGVKSTAITKLHQEFPERIASTDSMAWNSQARWNAFHGRTDRSGEARADAMGAWYQRQTAQLSEPLTQPILNFTP